MNASELLTGLATDPLQFVALCWPDMCLYEKQSEILLSLRDNIETFVHAANETGKSSRNREVATCLPRPPT